ncbi:hypothetical protein H0H93_016912 [Arthromyces matolae]|nr:hypothetical protein H0H93_016912 [Arthromyces matolae]
MTTATIVLILLLAPFIEGRAVAQALAVVDTLPASTVDIYGVHQPAASVFAAPFAQHLDVDNISQASTFDFPSGMVPILNASQHVQLVRRESQDTALTVRTVMAIAIAICLFVGLILCLRLASKGPSFGFMKSLVSHPVVGTADRLPVRARREVSPLDSDLSRTSTLVANPSEEIASPPPALLRSWV